jgi:tight adherence protein C
MSTLQLLFVGIIFVSVTAVALIILLQLAPSRAEKRLKLVADTSGYAEAKAQSGWTETVVKLAGSFARLSLPSEGWEQSPLRLRFIHAGYRGNGAVALYFGGKTVLAALFPALAYLCGLIAGADFGTSGLLLTLLCAAAVGYYLPNAVLSRLVFLRQREVFENFPDAADLMLVCVESGLGLDAALVKVTEEIRINALAQASASRCECSRTSCARNGNCAPRSWLQKFR